MFLKSCLGNSNYSGTPRLVRSPMDPKYLAVLTRVFCFLQGNIWPFCQAKKSGRNNEVTVRVTTRSSQSIKIGIDLSRNIGSSVHPKVKTEFMQTVNLLTIEWQLRVKGSNIYHCIVYQTSSSLIKNLFKKSYLFFKTKF